ncbi:hypothetical protein BGI42_07615 [Clostridium taeniosporum]|uniref:Uncharacterized protein n=1 Tax=Clostridium taeniosporum TaxID=394958 RepID=A0A1D7XJV4_9CLOT|nr:hypothetical protein BGI42_07615 [Clostridium taeniosporum]
MLFLFNLKILCYNEKQVFIKKKANKFRIIDFASKIREDLNFIIKIGKENPKCRKTYMKYKKMRD